MTTMLRDEVLRRGGEVRAVVHRHVARAPRLFGSVARGEETAQSDIDILVDAEPGCSLLDIAGIALELEAMFDRPVDIRTLGDLHPSIRPRVLDQSIAL